MPQRGLQLGLSTPVPSESGPRVLWRPRFRASAVAVWGWLALPTECPSAAAGCDGAWPDSCWLQAHGQSPGHPRGASLSTPGQEALENQHSSCHWGALWPLAFDLVCGEGCGGLIILLDSVTLQEPPSVRTWRS